MGLEQPRDERLRDVLERTWDVSKGTFGVKQLAREAKRVWAEDGQAGRPPTQAEVAEYIGLDERAQLRAPLPPWGGKTNPGTYPLERMDIDLVDFSKNYASKHKHGPRFVAMMQDRNSRYTWSRNLRNKDKGSLTTAYAEMIEEATEQNGGSGPKEINGDLESGFLSKDFQDMLGNHGALFRPQIGCLARELREHGAAG